RDRNVTGVQTCALPISGWLKCNGAAFSSEMYPNLAKAYPTLKLPDLRGEFIRGWDDGRGVDAGRGILSIQGWLTGSYYHNIRSRSEERRVGKECRVGWE